MRGNTSIVFHEGLKSYSCCADVNKREFIFEGALSLNVKTRRQSKLIPLLP